jgi:heme oxygenase
LSRLHDFQSKTAGVREGASPLRQQLKRETAELHQRLEAQLGLMDPELSIQRYQRVLRTLYGFYAPVEANLVRVMAAGPPLGFPLRTRCELIESDLHALGLARRELPGLPRCIDLPPLSCKEEVAGCLYVLEGACLGGQVIAPALHQQLGLAKGSGASFFVGDAEATSSRWILFLTWIDGLARGGARSDEIVASACATFLALGRWVEQQGTSLPLM